MYKVRPVFHAGIEFVQISKLPPKQAEHLASMIPCGSFLQIRVGNEVLNDCIRYDMYEQWYQLMRSRHYDTYLESQL